MKEYSITEKQINEIIELIKHMHIIKAKQILQNLPEIKNKKGYGRSYGY